MATNDTSTGAAAGSTSNAAAPITLEFKRSERAPGSEPEFNIEVKQEGHLIEKYRDLSPVELASAVGDDAAKIIRASIQKNEASGQFEYTPLNGVASMSAEPNDVIGLPPALQRIFVGQGGEYKFFNNQSSVAFVDKGSELHTTLNSKAVADAFVQIAKHRGWDEVSVSGSNDFRRLVWIAAQKENITINGYAPDTKELDTQAKTGQSAAPAQQPTKLQQKEVGVLVEFGRTHYQNDPTQRPSFYATLEHEGGERTTLWGAGISEAITAAGVVKGDTIRLARDGTELKDVTLKAGQAPTTIERTSWVLEKLSSAQTPSPQLELLEKTAAAAAAGRLSGKLVDYGQAPFEFKSENGKSYFATLEQPDGTRSTHWGVDIERALVESNALKGDVISLGKGASVPVQQMLPKVDPKTKKPLLDGLGKPVGFEQRTIKRTHWDAKVIEPTKDAAPASPSTSNPRLQQAKASDPAQPSERRFPDAPIKGTVMDHHEPWKNNEPDRSNYVIKLRNGKLTHQISGPELKDLVAENKVRWGDQIELTPPAPGETPQWSMRVVGRRPDAAAQNGERTQEDTKHLLEKSAFPAAAQKIQAAVKKHLTDRIDQGEPIYSPASNPVRNPVMKPPTISL